MANSKRARSGRPPIQPRASTYVGPSSVSPGLRRVREAARRDGSLRFTNLLHHITVELLGEAYKRLNPKAAPGVDGVTWAEYGEGLEDRLRDLHGRVHRGSYRAQPSLRTYIAKSDGRQRPLGIAALEDKIVLLAVVWVLHFLGYLRGGCRVGSDRAAEGEMRARSLSESWSRDYEVSEPRGPPRRPPGSVAHSRVPKQGLREGLRLFGSDHDASNTLQLSGLQLRISPRTEPAQRAGCRVGSDRAAEGEMRARRGQPQLFRFNLTRMDGKVRGTPCRRSADTAADTQVAVTGTFR